MVTVRWFSALNKVDWIVHTDIASDSNPPAIQAKGAMVRSNKSATERHQQTATATFAQRDHANGKCFGRP